jgi:hypothetical protein
MTAEAFKVNLQPKMLFWYGLAIALMMGLFFRNWVIPKDVLQEKYDFEGIPSIKVSSEPSRILAVVQAAMPSPESGASQEKVLSLRGVFARGNDLVALISLTDPTGGARDLVKARKGDMVGTWQIVQLGENRVVLERATDRRELEIWKVSKK